MASNFSAITVSTGYALSFGEDISNTVGFFGSGRNHITNTNVSFDRRSIKYQTIFGDNRFAGITIATIEVIGLLMPVITQMIIQFCIEYRFNGNLLQHTALKSHKSFSVLMPLEASRAKASISDCFILLISLGEYKQIHNPIYSLDLDK
nr:hypothetical protein [Ghiorsea bivora]